MPRQAWLDPWAAYEMRPLERLSIRSNEELSYKEFSETYKQTQKLAIVRGMFF